jgi:uncharacterized membrane protein (DUF4010 family)
MYLRIIFITLIINPSIITGLIIPMITLLLSALGTGYFISQKLKGGKEGEIDFRNPFELKSALLFGLAFGVILFVSKAAQEFLGTGGVYAASALGGITSVDAIIISVANLAGGLASKVVVISIVLATISNNIFKIIITAVYGSKGLRNLTLMGLGLLIIISLVYLLIYMFLP